MRAWSSRSSSPQARVDLEARVLVGHQRAHVVVADGLRGAVQRPGRERVDLGPERAQQRVDVDADVAHPVHRVAEDGDLQRAPARDRGRRPRPAADRLGERLGVPVVGDDVERAPGADHRVGRVLRAVDALVVGQVGHVPLGGDPGDGLDVGQADRQRRVRQRARHAHARAVGEHDHEQPVEPLALEVGARCGRCRRGRGRARRPRRRRRRRGRRRARARTPPGAR